MQIAMQTGKDAPRTWDTVHRYLVVNHVLLLQQSHARCKGDGEMYRVTTHPRGNAAAWIAVGLAQHTKAEASEIFNVALATVEAIDR